MIHGYMASWIARVEHEEKARAQDREEQLLDDIRHDENENDENDNDRRPHPSRQQSWSAKRFVRWPRVRRKRALARVL